MTKAEEVVFYAKLLDEKGLVNSLEGNISVLDRTEGKLYITPSGKRKSLLTPDMIAVMRGDEQVGGSCRRSSEYLLHRAALDARPDCSAAVHVHAPYLTAYAFCSRSIRLRCSTTFGRGGDRAPRSAAPCKPWVYCRGSDAGRGCRADRSGRRSYEDLCARACRGRSQRHPAGRLGAHVRRTPGERTEPT